MNKTNAKRGILPYIFLFIFILSIVYVVNIFNRKTNILTESEFLKNLTENKVTEMTITPRTSASVYEIEGKLEGYKENESFFIRLLKSDEVIKKIEEAKVESNVDTKVNADPDSSALLSIVFNFLPLILLVAFTFFFFSRQMAGNIKSMDFGLSKAKLIDDKQ